jgi:Ca2+-binding EF-hand superfamily protein
LQVLKPKLTEEQKKQLMECFELMDADGSGAIDSQELGNAFKVCGATAHIRARFVMHQQ